MTSMRFTPLSATILSLVLCGSAGVLAPGEAGAAPVLSDRNGMTLYVFDKDVGGVSDCYGMCAMFWPPAMAPAGATARDAEEVHRHLLSNNELPRPKNRAGQAVVR